MNYDTWTENQSKTSVVVDGHDLTVAYYESGRENGGVPVVLLHGIPTSSFLWRNVVTSLTDSRHVLVPDLLGYGNSSMDDGFDRSIRAQELMVEELIQLVETETETVSLVGHDIGGGVALRYAAHNPDSVDQLVLSNAVAYDSWPVDTIVELGLPTVLEEAPEKIDQLLEMAFSEEFMADTPADSFVEGMHAPWESDAGRLSLVRNAVSLNTNHTTELDYEEINAETLLLWGADDFAQPVSNAERLAGDVVDARIVELDNASHWVMEDRTDAYLDHLRSFLVDPGS